MPKGKKADKGSLEAKLDRMMEMLSTQMNQMGTRLEALEDKAAEERSFEMRTPETPRNVVERPARRLKDTRLSQNKFDILESDEEEENRGNADKEAVESPVLEEVKESEMKRSSKLEKAKKSTYRGPLPKVTVGSGDEANEVTQLIMTLEDYEDEYSDKALKAALKSRIRGSVLTAIDPKGKLTFKEMVEKIRTRFDSPKRLVEDENRIRTFRLKKGADRIEEVQRYLDLVEVLNARCDEAKAVGFVWSVARTMRHLIDEILERGTHFQSELDRLWSRIPPGKTEETTPEDIRDLVAGADKFAVNCEGNEKEARLSVLSNGALPRRIRVIVCWKCGEKAEMREGRCICNCNENPICAQCKGNHRSEFHGEVMRRRTYVGRNVQHEPTTSESA